MATGWNDPSVPWNSHYVTWNGIELGTISEQPPVGTLEEAFSQIPVWVDFPDGDTLISPVSDPLGYVRVFVFKPFTAGARYDIDVYDEGTYGGAGQWIDISERVRDLSWSRGSESPLDRERVGTSTVVLANIDGEASPWKVGGEFADVTGGESWLQPGTLVRFGAHFPTASPDMFEQQWLPFFTGRIESVSEGSDENTDGHVVLSVNETTADLAAFNGQQQGEAGAGETLEERVQRLLDDADWHASYVIDDDSVGNLATYQATAMAQNRLAELYLTGDSAGMRVLAGSAGELRVTSPQPEQAETTTTIFSNRPGVFGAYPMITITPYASTDRIVNTAIASRAGGEERTVMDRKSISKYGRQSPGGSRNDLIVQDDDVVIAMLSRLVRNQKNDALGIESVQLDMDQDLVNLPRLLSLYASTALEDRTPFQVIWYHPSGETYSVALVVTGMTHRITPTQPGVAMKWTATINTAVRTVPDVAIYDVDAYATAVYGFEPA